MTIATIPLYQKILYPVHAPISSPRVLHSNPTLDPLILNLISLALRAFVVPWYNGGISRDPDKEFLQAVTGILIHVVQALEFEFRMGSVDWEEVILREIPALLEDHYRDWDLATAKAGGTSTTSEIFHSLHPHIAISLTSSTRNPIVDPVYLRTLVDHLLKLLLPQEDYQAETERFLTREVIVGVVFGSLFGKVAQPWFLHGAIARVLEGRETSKITNEEKSTKSLLSTASRTLGVLSSTITSTISWLFSPILPSPNLRDAPLPPVHSQLLSLVLAILPQSTTLSHLAHYVSLPLSLVSNSLDTLLYSTITQTLRSQQTVRTVLEGIIRAMFPDDGYPSAKEPDPDEATQEELRRRCEDAIANLLSGELPRFSYSKHLLMLNRRPFT